MMSSRGIFGCSAAVLLVALSAAVDVYDDLLPARLETDLAYQEDNDLDLRHGDEMNVPGLRNMLLLRMIKELQANQAHSRLPYGPYLQKTHELQSRNFKDFVFKRIPDVMSYDSPRVIRPQPKWKTKKGSQLCFFKLCAFRSPA